MGKDLRRTPLGDYNSLTGDLTSSIGNSGTAGDLLRIVETASLVVDSTLDLEDDQDGVTTLREALAYAANLGGAQVITFSDGTGGTPDFTDATPETITLNGTELSITSPASVQGPGADKLILDADGNSRVFHIAASPLTLTLEGMTVRNGSSSGDGGGILNQSTGSVTLVGIHLDNNTALRGGGMALTAPVGPVHTLYNCTVSANMALNGAGLYSTANINVYNSTVCGNLSTALFSGLGGGIFIANGAALDLVNATVIVNGAFDGGGIYPSPIGGGGCIVLVSNSIVAGNLGANYKDVGPDAIYASFGGNFIGEDDTMFGEFASDATFASTMTTLPDVVNPLLADNGGPTPTHALVIGGPAQDLGLNSVVPVDTLDFDQDMNTTESLPFDQRGPGFVRIFGGAVDAGAYEINNSPPTLVGSGIPDQNAVEDAAPIQVTLSSYFADVDQASTTLTYSVETNTNAGLVTPSVLNDELTLTLTADTVGTADITIRATDTAMAFVESTFTLNVTKEVDLVVAALESADPVLAGNRGCAIFC